ncbi:hypothetical protein RchiOBHm_Chr1g0362781 [Rosa chinensis]|uniref:Uncharacterized protein n=1 Tax=Rosa chinensis TaxID=74649 RepID=A0A2P6SJA9_ROSCH|nr:hypothetical protein RchiOBHm_Chr1g0362781 [Rosa chinensis]
MSCGTLVTRSSLAVMSFNLTSERKGNESFILLKVHKIICCIIPKQSCCFCIYAVQIMHISLARMI